MTQIPQTTQALLGILMLVVLLVLLYRLLISRRRGLKLSLEMTKGLKEAVQAIQEPKKNTALEEDLVALEELVTHKLINQKEFKANQARLKKLYGKK